ncbi:MAG: hypothetical protein IJ597_04375 [Synergistaceae bacterium]|nr:hypothetical protein [Synergistaceae bacterium]
MNTTLDTALISRMTGGLWHDNSEKSAPIKEKSASIPFYRQAPEHEEQESRDISEPVAKLKNFLDGYYSEIHPITGKKQSVEEYLSEVITDAKDDLRRGNYFVKEAQLEFLEELEGYLTVWQKVKSQKFTD